MLTPFTAVSVIAPPSCHAPASSVTLEKSEPLAAVRIVLVSPGFMPETEMPFVVTAAFFVSQLAVTAEVVPFHCDTSMSLTVTLPTVYFTAPPAEVTVPLAVALYLIFCASL